jgi:predicted Holliday junction resolvase-like endonuclease
VKTEVCDDENFRVYARSTSKKLIVYIMMRILLRLRSWSRRQKKFYEKWRTNVESEEHNEKCVHVYARSTVMKKDENRKWKIMRKDENRRSNDAERKHV